MIDPAPKGAVMNYLKLNIMATPNKPVMTKDLVPYLKMSRKELGDMLKEEVRIVSEKLTESFDKQYKDLETKMSEQVKNREDMIQDLKDELKTYKGTVIAVDGVLPALDASKLTNLPLDKFFDQIEELRKEVDTRSLEEFKKAIGEYEDELKLVRNDIDDHRGLTHNSFDEIEERLKLGKLAHSDLITVDDIKGVLPVEKGGTGSTFLEGVIMGNGYKKITKAEAYHDFTPGQKMKQTGFFQNIKGRGINIIEIPQLKQLLGIN